MVCNNKNRKRIQKVWMLLAVLLLPIGSSGVKAEDFAVQTGTQAEWIIDSVSKQPVPWYRIDVWTHLGSWTAENGSKLSYVVTEANEEVFGDLVIGNLTVTNSSSAESASNLVLGVLSWGPGLITHTNWTKHIKEAQEQVRSEWINGTLEIKETTETYMTLTLETISFTMVSASQNTSLVYDKNSGILLEAQTGFGLYFLELELFSTDPPLKEVKGQFLGLTWMFVILPFLLVTRHRIRKRRTYNTSNQ